MFGKSVRLGDLGQIFDGPHATPKRQTNGPYFLNISSLVDGRLDLGLSDHVGLEDFARWTKRVKPRENDLLFSYETRLGDAALMPSGVDACLGRRMALLRPDPNVVVPRFLLYLYLSPAFKKVIDRHTIHGATVNRIPISTMTDWSVRIPSYGEQRAIAEVLGALDDKIAANTDLHGTGLQLVDARFLQAVREAPLSDRTFGDIAHVGGGGTPRTSIDEYWGGDVAWATPTDVTALRAPYIRETSRTITEQGLEACASPLYPTGSILMTSRATIGAFARAEVPIAVNQGFIVVNAKDPVLQWWLFHEMRTRVDEFVTHANGATFLELSRGRFKNLAVRLPQAEQGAAFSSFAEAIHGRAAAADRENAMLARTRDELLPLLMSGKVRVKDAEKVVEEVV